MQLIQCVGDMEKQDIEHPKLLYRQISSMHKLDEFFYCVRSRENLDELARKVKSPLIITPFRLDHKSSCECMILYESLNQTPIVESYLYQACTKRPKEDLEDVLNLAKPVEKCDAFERFIWLNIAMPVVHSVKRLPVKCKIGHPALKDIEKISKLSPPEMFYDIFRAYVDTQLVLTDDVLEHK